MQPLVTSFLPSAVALDFFEGMFLIILIINFIMLFNFFSNGIIKYPVINVIVTSVITFVLLQEAPWMHWLLFAFLFAYAFFWSFKPWEWSK